MNVTLLQKVLDHITAHPEEHDQNFYAIRRDCGTTMCVAGHTVVFAGYTIDWSRAALLSDGGIPGVWVHDRFGERHLIDRQAAYELRLDYETAWRLFADDNTLEDLWRIGQELADGQLVVPPAYRV